MNLNDMPAISVGNVKFNAGEDLMATAKSRHWKELTLYTQEERNKTVSIADVLGI